MWRISMCCSYACLILAYEASVPLGKFTWLAMFFYWLVDAGTFYFRERK